MKSTVIGVKGSKECCECVRTVERSVRSVRKLGENVCIIRPLLLLLNPLNFLFQGRSLQSKDIGWMMGLYGGYTGFFSETEWIAGPDPISLNTPYIMEGIAGIFSFFTSSLFFLILHLSLFSSSSSHPSLRHQATWNPHSK